MYFEEYDSRGTPYLEEYLFQEQLRQREVAANTHVSLNDVLHRCLTESSDFRGGLKVLRLYLQLGKMEGRIATAPSLELPLLLVQHTDVVESDNFRNEIVLR